jgi:uncharacterized membrane protein
MNFQPLAEATLAIQLHVATIVPAFVLGTWLIFFSTKGSRYHRLAGKAYLTLMVLTSIAAVFVRSFSGWSLEIGPVKLGLIHLFIPLTLNGVWGTLAALRAGNIKAHQASMKGVYFGALIVAGLLTFAPGRIMYRLFLG